MRDEFDNLIKSFKEIKFDDVNKKQTTFFDVAGFPHYENVASNILRFFLDTNNDGYHCFGNVWLTSIIDSYNQSQYVKEQIPVAGYFTEIVERERLTEDDKRIDLFIDCGPYVLIIENKIYADVYNDLNSYRKMAQNYVDATGGKKKVIGIVLSLFPVKDNKNLIENDFVNIVYEDVFKYIESNWNYDKNNKWHVLAKDFITNIRQLRGIVNMKFDSEWIKFVQDNGNVISKLFELQENDLNNRLIVLREIDNAFEDYQGIIRHGVYNSSSETFMSQYVDVYKDGNSTICIETYLMKKITNKYVEKYNKLYVAVWTRKNKNYDFTEILKKLNVKDPKLVNSGGWGKYYILEEVELDDHFNLQQLKEKIVSFVNGLTLK